MSSAERILIANRGEIALRIARTVQELGKTPVGVYSDADKESLLTRTLDEAHRIGPATAAASYLNIDSIIKLAKEEKCDAIHPGYGFLSENAEFAERVEEAGITFIGPAPQHIRALGNKLEALRLAREANIPTLESSLGTLSDEELLGFAQRSSYPFIIKAASGGGGRGMRVVRTEDELRAGLHLARAEAKKFFSDDTVYLERYLASPRHIEVQVFGDGRGQGVHFFTRDCSVQRRHQKVIEEAPAPFLSKALSEKLCDAALMLVRRLSYRNAGTVEFLVTADEEFFFLEMNTRIQVEHPVTELITGLDLVALQIRLALEGDIPEEFRTPQARGHAIELRLIAEDPSKDFAPQTGTIQSFEISSEFHRIDSGFEGGDAVSMHYDSLLAKLMILAPTRSLALEKARQAVRLSTVEGITTNLSFLNWLLCRNDFLQSAVPITFLERHFPKDFASISETYSETYGNWQRPEDGVEQLERVVVASSPSKLPLTIELLHRRDGTFLAVPLSENGKPMKRSLWRFSNCRRSLLRSYRSLCSND